jgi:hypothetical protein
MGGQLFYSIMMMMDRYPIKKGKGVKGPRRFMYHVRAVEREGPDHDSHMRDS